MALSGGRGMLQASRFWDDDAAEGSGKNGGQQKKGHTSEAAVGEAQAGARPAGSDRSGVALLPVVII
jgi:hypothetical protein